VLVFPLAFQAACHRAFDPISRAVNRDIEIDSVSSITTSGLPGMGICM